MMSPISPFLMRSYSCWRASQCRHMRPTPTLRSFCSDSSASFNILTVDGPLLAGKGIAGSPGATPAAADQDDADGVVLGGVDERHRHAGQGRGDGDFAALFHQVAA